jgi:F420-non-reducing hydrogenase iron-sulfur subunit
MPKSRFNLMCLAIPGEIVEIDDIMAGCHPGDCHYGGGNLKAQERAEAIKLMLEDFGLEQKRYRLEWVSTSEGKKFAQVVNDMVGDLKKIGPNPFKG